MVFVDIIIYPSALASKPALHFTNKLLRFSIEGPIVHVNVMIIYHPISNVKKL